MLTAKMIGITPAWLTRSGRKVVPPWYMRRPRTRLAYWIGMRRWPSVTKMIAAMAKTPKTAKTARAARLGESMNVPIAWGARPTMPAKMMKLIPLPIPFSVMSSPSHISRMEPAVRVTIWVSVSKDARSKRVLRTPAWLRTARKP